MARPLHADVGLGAYVLHATPLGRYQEQSSLAHASEHASEAAAVKVDRLQHLTTFADAHATLVGNVTVPDGVVGIDADAVGDAVADVAPFLMAGRLKPGVTIEQAQQEMKVIAQRLAERFPDSNKGRTVSVEPLQLSCTAVH